jgi:dihydrofolate reductase
MRIIISDFMSLDGVVQAPGGQEEDTDGGFQHGGWSMPFFDPEVMGEFIGNGFQETEALLFGRRTWRVMADAWPNRAGDEVADQKNAIPKYVASRTLTEQDLDWNNTTLLGGDDALGAIRDLRAEPGGGLQVMGSASLARQLVDNDLVDEINLMIEPVLLGGGKRVFPDSGRKRELELVSTAIAKTGVVICKYRPQGNR